MTGSMMKSVLLVTTLAMALRATSGFVPLPHARIQQPAASTTKPLHAVYMDGDVPSNGLFASGNLNNRHSASDWLYNVLSLPKSSVLRDIRNPVLSIAAWSGVVSVIQRILASSSSRMLQGLSTNMCIGATPHSFLVSSLGLLLVFRTNSAYQRFYVSLHQSFMEVYPLRLELGEEDSRVEAKTIHEIHESF